ncbi:hypothetical protein DICPUDRAFT_25810, partial [Dictyostelium purpureum]
NFIVPMSVCQAAASSAHNYATCGCPYIFGGTSCGCGGSGGMDCSGLVYTSYQEAGFSGIQRTASQQYDQGFDDCGGGSSGNSDTSGCIVGDLLFYCFEAPCPSHVTMYVGNGQMAECPQPGQDCHVIPVYSEAYYGCKSVCG